MAPSAQAPASSGLNRHAPTSSWTSPCGAGWRKADGARPAHCRHPSPQRAGSRVGRPRNRSGKSTPPRGNGEVRIPCCSLARSQSSTAQALTSEVMPGVRQVEALVAEREVGDLVPRHRQPQRRPVVKGGIGHLVPADAAVRVGRHDVHDLAAPPFHHRDRQFVRAQRSARHADGALGESGQLLDRELEGPLDFEPPHHRAGEHVARPHRGDRDVGEAEDPPGVVVPHVARQLAGPRDGPDETVLDARRARHDADALEPGLDRCALEQQREHRGELLLEPLEPIAHLAGHGRRDVERRPAGPHEPAAVAVARERHQQVEALSPHASQVRGRGLEGDVPGDRAEIPDVVRQALQLERDTSHRLSPRRLAAPGQRLDHAAERPGVADDRVSRDRLGDEHAAIPVDALEQPLHATVLIAQHDLEEQHLLAVRLEPEIAGLDDPGVHGADCDLVHFLPFHPEERIRLALHRGRRPARREVIGRMAPQRLEPGMAFRNHAALLRNLPLERVGLGTGRRERRVARPNHRARRAELPTHIVGQDRDEARLIALLRHAEQRRQQTADRDELHDRFPKLLHRLHRYGAQRDGPPIPEAELAAPEAAHGAVPPRAAAARARTSCNGPGMYTPSIRTTAASATGPATSHELSRTGTVPGSGSPSAIPSTSAAIPTKMIASISSITAAIQGCPAAIAARKIVNSLMNSPNGGEPVTAKRPSTRSAPETGSVRTSPRLPAAVALPVASTIFAVTRNTQPFDRPLFTRWSMLPYAPTPPSPSPSTSSPMCSTLEYARRRFTSLCPMMNTAATVSDRRPKPMSTGCANDPSPAAITTSVTRATPRKAQLVSAPAMRPLTRLGASP